MPITANDLDREATFVSGVTAGGVVAPRSYWTDGLTATSSTADKWPSGPIGTGGALRYSFGASSHWTAAEKSSFRGAMGLWSSIADIRFIEVKDGSAQMVINRGPNGAQGAATDRWEKHSIVGSTVLGELGGGKDPFDLNIDTRQKGFSHLASFEPYEIFKEGHDRGSGYGVATVVHELGHAIGLGHGGEYNAGNKDANTQAAYDHHQETAADNTQWTIMSYIQATDSTAPFFKQNQFAPKTETGVDHHYPTTPGIVDILALRRLYGPSKHSLLNGNQTFGFNTNIKGDIAKYFDFTVNKNPVVTLFSTGKHNTLDLSGFTAPATVDLRPGAFSSAGGMTYNIGIALSTAIDRAVGGAGDDRFTLNGHGDTVDGGGGTNTVVTGHELGAYTHLRHGDALLLRTGAPTDRLTNIQHLKFTDGTVLLGQDPLIDDMFYARHNPDVFHATVAAGSHYAQSGWHEGRDPNAFFATTAYLAANPDVAASGMDPLAHYHQFGWQEGRDPSAAFSTSLYLLHNPDVAASGMDPLAHYLQFGQAEHRRAEPVIGSAELRGAFDPRFYLLANPDVAGAGVDPMLHWQGQGAAEGRDPDAFFNTSAYLRANPDVAAAGVNPLDHYLQSGWAEGRNPSPRFDTNAYLAHNPDVAAAAASGQVNALVHYLQFGVVEGRSSFGTGL